MTKKKKKKNHHQTGSSRRTRARTTSLPSPVSTFTSLSTSLLRLRWSDVWRGTAPHGWWSPDLWSATAVSISFAMSRLHWTYAVQSEVFSLNNLSAALLIVIHAQLRYTKDHRWVYVASLVAGWGLTNQHTLVLLAAPLAAHAVLGTHRHTLLRVRPCLALGALFVLGLSPYVWYLPWASQRGKAGSWGNLTTVAGWFTHLLRSEYGTFKLYSGHDAADRGAYVGKLVAYYVRDLRQDVGVGGVVLLGVSFGRLAGVKWPGVKSSSQAGQKEETKTVNGPVATAIGSRSNPQSEKKVATGTYVYEYRGALDLCVLWVGYNIFFAYMTNFPSTDDFFVGVLERFWMQGHVLAHIVIAPGLHCVLRYLNPDPEVEERSPPNPNPNEERSPPHPHPSPPSPPSPPPPPPPPHLPFPRRLLPLMTSRSSLVRLLRRAMPACLVPIVFGAVLRHRYDDRDQSRAVTTLRAAAHALVTAPPRARIMIHGDYWTNSMRYLQQCAGVRPDVGLWEIQMSTYPWFVIRQAPDLLTKGFVVPKSHLPNHIYYFPGKGWSMRDFVRANYRAEAVQDLRDQLQRSSTATGGGGDDLTTPGPLMLLGGWHVQDNSQSADVVAIPWGNLSLVVPKHPLGSLDAAIESSVGFREWINYSRSLIRSIETSLHFAGAAPDLLAAHLAATARREKDQSGPDPMEPYPSSSSSSSSSSSYGSSPTYLGEAERTLAAVAVVRALRQYGALPSVSTWLYSPQRLGAIAAHGLAVQAMQEHPLQTSHWVRDARRWETVADVFDLRSHVLRVNAILSHLDSGRWRDLRRHDHDNDHDHDHDHDQRRWAAWVGPGGSEATLSDRQRQAVMEARELAEEAAATMEAVVGLRRWHHARIETQRVRSDDDNDDDGDGGGYTRWDPRWAGGAQGVVTGEAWMAGVEAEAAREGLVGGLGERTRSEEYSTWTSWYRLLGVAYAHWRYLDRDLDVWSVRGLRMREAYARYLGTIPVTKEMTEEDAEMRQRLRRIVGGELPF